MIIRLLPTYIYLFMEAQIAQPFHSNVKLLRLNNFDLEKVKYTQLSQILILMGFEEALTSTYYTE